MKKPEGCKTPNRNRDEYALTVPDIKFMEKQALKINRMLKYYVNMPENKTGELSTRNYDRMDYLMDILDDIVNTLNGVSYHC